MDLESMNNATSLGVAILIIQPLRACLYDPGLAGRDDFIPLRRETRLGEMACLHGENTSHTALKIENAGNLKL